MWWAFGAALLYLEFFSAGIAVLNKSLGESRWYLALIPVYGLQYLGNLSGDFKVLAVPVKKTALFMAELFVVILLCCAYWQWGNWNVQPKGARYLGQIMILPVVICYALMYLAVLSSSMRIYKRFYAKKLVWMMLASLFLLPIPVFFFSLKDKKAMPLCEMFD